MLPLELLSPAGNADIGIQAIRHGADAVYIGPPSHGARSAAANSLDDIRRLTDYAHIFDARVYVTVNTIIYENELRDVERMIRELYDIGVDALIVQDMALLRMDIPPIALHASTQCDIRTPEKARFLQEAGFSQLVLARELSLEEIGRICRAVTIPVETFVHGALCVSFSGRCGAGFACAGRSGNRGECPQICRQSFTLTDADGKVLAKDRYLLSLKDFRADRHLEALIEAGVSSFKIEGRLKEEGYVKNITAAYSQRLDDIIRSSGGKYRRSSFGEVELKFKPQPEKSFNRGFTDYRLSGSPDSAGLASILTPKSQGEPITDINQLRPGDGISYIGNDGRPDGLLVNGIKNGRIIGNRPFTLPKGAEIRRTASVEWKKLMASETATRKLRVDITLSKDSLSAVDETGIEAQIPNNLEGTPASSPTDYRKIFEKLGNTPFRLGSFTDLTDGTFYPASALTALRRSLINTLLEVKRQSYCPERRREENLTFPYPAGSLDYRDNVANSMAEAFYRDHGVAEIQPALEVNASLKGKKGLRVMSSRHCILRELGLCLKSHPRLRLPLTLRTGSLSFRPLFDCSSCQMHLDVL